MVMVPTWRPSGLSRRRHCFGLMKGDGWVKMVLLFWPSSLLLCFCFRFEQSGEEREAVGLELRLLDHLESVSLRIRNY